MDGRGVGTPGLDEAAEYIARGVRGGRARRRAATTAAGSRPSSRAGRSRRQAGHPAERRRRACRARKAASGRPVGGDRRPLRPPGHGLARRARRERGQDPQRRRRQRLRRRRAARAGARSRPDAAARSAASSSSRSPARSGGCKGSQHYVETMKRWPAAEGHRDDQPRHRRAARRQAKLQVLGAGTATEWRHIAHGRRATRPASSPTASPRIPRAATRRVVPRGRRARGAALHGRPRRLPPAHATTWRRSTPRAW